MPPKTPDPVPQPVQDPGVPRPGSNPDLPGIIEPPPVLPEPVRRDPPPPQPDPWIPPPDIRDPLPPATPLSEQT